MGNIYTRSKQAQPEMDYSSLNESRQGLKSQKLFNIIKQHGGFEEKTPSFYLHDMTDDDVVGIIPEDDLKKLNRMHPNDINNYAIQHGFKINRGDMMRIIPLKDWTWIGIIERNSEIPDYEFKKTRLGKLDRERRNALYTPDGAKDYQWSDKSRAAKFRSKANDIRRRYHDALYNLDENNMAKIVLKEEDLMALVNESVKKVINEAIQNGELDEGFWGNIGQGIKGAFGGDANRVASAVRTGVDKAKNMGQNAYNAVKNAGQKVAGAAKDAYGTVQTGVNQRVNAFKANYAAGQNADKINNVISTLRELQQNGVISGAKTNATINELERLLQMGMRGMRGRATQASNRIGKEE